MGKVKCGEMDGEGTCWSPASRVDAGLTRDRSPRQPFTSNVKQTDSRR